MQFQLNFTDNITLVYDLVDQDISRDWSTLISKKTITDCCEINHYSGCYNPKLLNNRIARLYELVDIINEYIPNKIEKLPFTKENYNVALNIMHVHFPELENQIEYQHLRGTLSEYNDIIHWLEPMLIDYYNDVTDNRRFSIKLDFNKNVPFDTYEIPETAHSLFNGYFVFGQLMLHYVHVGRHAWELFFANDLVCPKEQYVPQSVYSPTVRLHFYNNSLTDSKLREDFRKRWEQYYEVRGGKEFFGCDIDDPKIRFGYCQIGQLSKIIIDNEELPIPRNATEISPIRNKLVEASIIDWQII